MSKYGPVYIQKAFETVQHFREVCGYLGYNPEDPSQFDAIVKALCDIGQFGTNRLARKYPQVNNEENFRLTSRVALNFYWMVLDFWDEQNAEQIKKEREAAKPKKRRPRVR